MDTVGSIYDKISIVEKKIEVLQKKYDELKLTNDSNWYNVGWEIQDLQTQLGWFYVSLAETIIDCFKGKRPTRFPKKKQYDSNIQNVNNNGTVSNIKELDQRNRNLWELEDIRRDKNLDDSTRLLAADKVSKENKLRNDAIDLIDEKLLTYISRAAGQSKKGLTK
jgi:hypothetical protein